MGVDNNSNLPPRIPAPSPRPTPPQTPKSDSSAHARKADLQYGNAAQLEARRVNDTSGTEVRTEEQNQESAQVQGELQKESFSPSSQAHPQLVKTQAKTDAKAAQKQQGKSKPGGLFLKNGKAAKPKAATQTNKATAPKNFADGQRIELRNRLQADAFTAAPTQKKNAVQDPNDKMMRFTANPMGKKNGPKDTGPRSGKLLETLPHIGGQHDPSNPQSDANALRQHVLASKAKQQSVTPFKPNPALKLFADARTSAKKDGFGAAAGQSGGASKPGPSLMGSLGGAQAKGNQNPLGNLGAAPRGGLGNLTSDAAAPAASSNVLAFGSKPPQSNVVGIETNSAWSGMAPSVSLDKGAVATAFNGSLIGFPSPVPQQKTA